MSSINFGGISQGLSQFLQSLAGTSSTQPTAASNAASATSPTSATAASQLAGAISGAGHHHHRHGGGKGFEAIQQAVTSALQSAQSNGSTADPNQTIEDAISQVLKNLGVGSTSGASPAGPSADGDNDGLGQAAGQTGTVGNIASPTNSTQSFFQLLKDNGVNPQQFFKDFLSAVQQAQNGGPANAATALQSLPSGSIVDTTG